MKIGTIEIVVVLAEIPLAVGLSKVTGWAMGPVVVGVMVIGTPLLLTLVGLVRKALGPNA